MKAKVQFYCTECGNELPKWAGQCPACHAWNTITERPAESKRKAAGSSMSVSMRESGRTSLRLPKQMKEIEATHELRFETGMNELDRVLGGGAVKGSLVLVGGAPGIGKSTLMLQICDHLCRFSKVLYVSGEESERQIKLRSERLQIHSDGLYLLSETNLEEVVEAVHSLNPDILIIDSIQTMFREEIASAPGSVSQVRESTNLLMQIAKGEGITIFIVGHVTKEGVVAGPRVLEHMVDTVLYFEGDRHASYRILRGVKNRFGSTNEIGVFEMREQGLVEVENPSEFMLDGRPEDASGAIVACAMEGTRPILLEVQALVAQTNLGIPRRTAAGTDYNRVNLLMAVLERRCHYEMGRYDAYVNIAGGMKMNEPALDLAIVMALVSSLKDRPVSPKTIVFGEVGLSGEVRAVSMAEQRVNEAIKLGFDTCILPQICLEKIKKNDKIRLIGVRSVREAIGIL